MAGHKSFVCVAIALVCVAALTLGIYSFANRSDDADGKLAARLTESRVEQGALVKETIIYQRCAHEVTHTVNVPSDWITLTQDELVAKLGMSYRVTDFAPNLIATTKTLMLFCPAHWVLMPDETGKLSVWVNRFGEMMERVYDTEWTTANMPEDVRESLRIGIPFDTLEEAERYIDGMR